MLHLTLRPNWWNGVCRSFLTKRNQGNWIRGFQDVRASLKPTPHGDAGRSFQMPRKYQQRCHHHQGPEVYQDCLGVFWNYRNHTKLVLKTFKKLSSEWVPSECSKSRYFGELYLLTPKIHFDINAHLNVSMLCKNEYFYDFHLPPGNWRFSMKSSLRYQEPPLAQQSFFSAMDVHSSEVGWWLLARYCLGVQADWLKESKSER